MKLMKLQELLGEQIETLAGKSETLQPHDETQKEETESNMNE